MKDKSLFLFVILFLATTSLLVKAQHSFFSNKDIDHVIFLLGDAGKTKSSTSEVFNELLKQIKPHENKSTVVFLGDNIYPAGMPNKNEKGRKEAENIIKYQLDRLKTSKATTYFIPGNHDWSKGKPNGLDYILNEAKVIKKALGKKGTLIPKNGCPGPMEIRITNNLVLIALDTQWWLHQYEKGPIKTGDCGSVNTHFVINNLKDILSDNKDKNVIVVGHHPIISKGNHGGKYSIKDHIFPLTNVVKGLYLPLPILGSIYPFYRHNIGSIQDLAHPEYQHMINELQAVFDGHENLVYASGHEHNLEYFFKNNMHYVVSGSGSKVSHVKKLKAPNFSSKQKGFFKITYLKDGSALMEAYGIVNGKQNLY